MPVVLVAQRTRALHHVVMEYHGHAQRSSWNFQWKPQKLPDCRPAKWQPCTPALAIQLAHSALHPDTPATVLDWHRGNAETALVAAFVGTFPDAPPSLRVRVARPATALQQAHGRRCRRRRRRRQRCTVPGCFQLQRWQPGDWAFWWRWHSGRPAERSYAGAALHHGLVRFGCGWRGRRAAALATARRASRRQYRTGISVRCLLRLHLAESSAHRRLLARHAMPAMHVESLCNCAPEWLRCIHTTRLSAR